MMGWNRSSDFMLDALVLTALAVVLALCLIVTFVKRLRTPKAQRTATTLIVLLCAFLLSALGALGCCSYGASIANTAQDIEYGEPERI